MGTTKVEAYNTKQNELAALIKAIAHPARLAILAQLLERKTCVCNDMVLKLDLAQATVSQHLKALKQAGLIQGTVEGRKVCYCINADKYEYLRRELGVLLPELSDASQCC